MSNKNLKVYRIQFITQVGDMQFKVKFPCQVKLIWKRSNETAESTLVPVENGVVHFNQTLKMYVNMYFDTTLNKFVQKKCMYSFLIITDKGQKSAGTVTYDLAEFFNKRIYELEEEFPLQKCPLPDTKIKMKIFYEESTETGYDSMSRISTSSQLDVSTASMDLNELNNSHAKSSNLLEETSTRKSEGDTASKEPSSQKDKESEAESNYDLLNESDLGANIQTNTQGNENHEKISQNIQALNKITGKINDFVSRCSGNIKTEIQNLKHKNRTLDQSVSSSKFQIQKLTKEKDNQHSLIQSLQKQLRQSKVTWELQLKKQKEKTEQIIHKCDQSQKLCSQLENSLQQKGSSQTSYMAELKQSFEEREERLKRKVDSQAEQIQKQKKDKAELEGRLKKMESTARDIKEKLLESQQKNKQYEQRQSQRQKELAELRSRLENVYEQIVKSIGNIGV